MRLNPAVWLLLLAWATEPARSQEPEVTQQENVAARSFEQAKAIGLQRSSLRNRKRPEVAATPKPDLDEFAAAVKPVLIKSCVQCHGAETQEGNVRIDTLNPDLLHGNDTDWWVEVLAVLTNDEMPPPDEVALSDADRRKIVEWLSKQIQVASLVRRASGEHSSFRRMTSYEFNYALQDLLGLPYDFAKDLPPEADSEDGFQNSSELLHMSVSQLETYRRLARAALLRATVRGERPPVLYWGVAMRDAGRIDWAGQEKQIEEAASETDPEKRKRRLQQLDESLRKPHSVPYYKDLVTGRTVRASWEYRQAKYAFEPMESPPAVPTSFDHVAILPRGRSHRFTIELGNRVPDEGIMRVRVRASRATTADSGIPSLQLLFGWQASNEGRALLPVGREDIPIAASPDEPEIYQWDIPLGEIYPRNSVRKTSMMGAMPNPSEYIRLVNNSVSQGPIRIDYVEIAAPIHDEWPPRSHKRIFIDGENRTNEPAHAREVLTTFMERAWRRPVTSEEVNQKLQLYAIMRDECDSSEEAMIEVLATVLASPQFLYVISDDSTLKNGRLRLSGSELATRLSMFLWCSIPDAELRTLGSDGKLHEPDVLSSQITRMLTDERARRFSKHFVHQWLDMQLLEFRTLDQKRVDPRLKQAMQREPVALFDEILRHDASVLDFIHSDYTMANERLALHYGLRSIKGNNFRRVGLNAGQKRGGLLTQAGLLAMNSAGDDSHPLKRGVWLLESLLNDPPPPPPPAVPEIDLADPKIAKMTLKEQIEDHRNHAACMSCHAKIDPWGIAFEHYDAMGRWRDQINGKPVDATSTLFNNQKLDGMDGLKRFLLENRQDQFVRALVHKLATYGLGRPLTFADHASVDEITTEVRKRGDGLATIVRLIASSDLFRTN